MNKTLFAIAAITLMQDTLMADTFTLKPLEVTSTAIATDELRATDAVEVYTQEDIEKAHVRDLYEFFDQQTSLSTMPSYGNPFSQKLDLHGYGIGDGHQNIVIRLDGRRLNNIDLAPQLLASISPSSIERIEIIKSSGIVTAGDGANAGVIDITTRKSDAKVLTLYGGTYGSLDGSFYVGHDGERLALSASGEAQRNGGIRQIEESGDRDKSRLVTGTFDLAYMPTDALELRLNAMSARTDVDYAGYLTKAQYEAEPTQPGTSYTTQAYDTDSIGAGLSYYIDDDLSIDIDAAHEKKRSDSTNVSLFGPYEWSTDYQYDSFHASVEYASDLLQLSSGIDGFDGERVSHATLYSIANETSKKDLAGHIMSQWQLGASTIKAGYRYEQVDYDYEDAFQTNSDAHTLHGAELGYNYTLDGETSLFANYAHSYQAPDIDRFFTFGGAFNAFIEPMKADSYTLGFNHLRPDNKFRLSIYYVDLKDEIYYYSDAVTGLLSVNTNIDKSHKYGIDLYDRWFISPQFDLVIDYNYVQAVIDEETGRNGEDLSGNRLPGVSDHNAKATIRYMPDEKTTLSLTQVYRSEAYAANDFSNAFSQKQDAFHSTNIAVTYVTERYELFAKINNVFDQSNGIWIQDDVIYPVEFTTTAIAGLTMRF